MAKPDHQLADKKGSPSETAAWGTWEELLLAYAVNRFGTNSWDSISSELRKRSSAPILLTPHHCKRKYQELQRRFQKSNPDDDGGDTTTATDIPWLNELRKLRVAELQRQLQNFDDYIASLQLKVKKLTEKNEKNSDSDQKKTEIEIKNEDGLNNKPSDPMISGDEPLLGGSMNGSNGNLEIGVEKSENESSPVGTGDEPVRLEDSCNGRPADSEPVKTEPDGGVSEAPESMAESKSEGTIKETSDVQSSASKSRKERSDRMRRGSSKEDEEQSKDKIPVRSLPLVTIMQKIQKLGSAIFERRLDRQGKVRYKKLIRQDIDFETLRTRLEEGRYADGNHKFFRDLLLLVNNTIVFFPNDSSESVAAIELRKYILKELMSKRRQKTDLKLIHKQNSSKATPLPPKQTPELKPKLAGPIIVCRKRSSITSKASGSSSGGDRRKESEENENPTKTRDGFHLESKKDKKKVNEVEEKKQSAAKFLNRMKQSSSASNNEGLEGTGSPGKKNVGRPPRRGAVPTPVAGLLGKRNKESGESESSASKQSKKRSKR